MSELSDGALMSSPEATEVAARRRTLIVRTRTPHIFACLLALAPLPARGDMSISAGALVWRDELGFHQNQLQLAWQRDAESSGQHLLLRFHQYGLKKNLNGIFAFEGTESAAELGGYLARGLWWTGAAIGFQGVAQLSGATGQLVMARAFPIGLRALTPRLVVARAPAALLPLPLSVGLMTWRAEAALAWRSPRWIAEAVARVSLWDAVDATGRVQSIWFEPTARNRLAAAHGYVMTTWESWFNVGLSGKAEWASENTFLATQIYPWVYAWYPIEAPPFRWETALLLRAGGSLARSFSLLAQVKLPAASQEARLWEGVRRTYWGTAPFEAKLEASWSPFETTTVQLTGLAFAKPWERWDLTAPGTYRQISVQLSLQQRF